MGKERLRAVVGSLMDAHPGGIEVDLADVELLETVVAAFLVREQVAAAELGTRLRLTGARSIPSKILALARAQR